MKITCSHVDTCLPDYWGGHHLPHVQVAVWRGISPKQLRELIFDELRQGAVMGGTDNARLLSADLVRPDEEKQADRVTRAAYAAVNRDVRPIKKGTRRLFLDIEPEPVDDGFDSVYAYFVFREVTP